MNQRLGHFDGYGERGIKRFRKPPDWFESVRGSGSVDTTICVGPGADPMIGEEIEVAGTRYVVRHKDPRDDIPRVAMLPDEYYVDLLLDEVDPDPAPDEPFPRPGI